MNYKKTISITLAFVTCLVMIMSGCEKKTVKPELHCPFTELGWNSTTKEIIAAENTEYNTYDSVYGGTTYTFPKEYEGKTGTIKYMFDDKDKLMCVAWTYDCQEVAELEKLYNQLNDFLTKEYGDSHYDTEDSNNVNNMGNIWYLDSGDIILSAVNTEQQQSLQYAYLHPNVSNKEEAK